jgi:hypothetical protein
VTGNATRGTDGAELGEGDDDNYWDDLPAGKHPGDIGDFFEAVVRAIPTVNPKVEHWDDPVPIDASGFWGSETAGGSVAVAHLPGATSPAFVAFHIDNPAGPNRGYYRVGLGVDAAGHVVGGWSNPVEIGGWFGNENQGGGCAVADLDGDGKPELVVFILDHRSDGNFGWYRIGPGLDTNGHVTGTWTDRIPVPDSLGTQSQAGGIAIGDLNGDGKPELVVFYIDHPAAGNRGYYRVGWDLGNHRRG